MKIVIGSNTFGKYHRQDVAVDSWKYLQSNFDVDVYDIQFADEKSTFENPYDLHTIHDLKRSSKSILSKSKKKLPFVNDIISCLSNIDCDYFIFTNSDVIINNNLIKFIQNNKPVAFGCSRLDIQDVKSFQDILDKKVTPVRYEIAGFDTFVFKKKWYLDHVDLFRDYLLSMPVWDQVYTTLMKIYGNNDLFGNNYPPYCFHIHHEMNWQQTDSMEKEFNINSNRGSHMDRLMCKIFDTYLQSVLIKRQPWGAFITPVKAEEVVEKEFFNKLKV